MSIKVEILNDSHVDELAERMQKNQSDVARAMRDTPNYAAMMRAAGPCGAFLINGNVVAAAGLIDYEGTNRAVVWCAYAEDVKVPFIALHKYMIRKLNYFPRRRLEAYVDPAFKAAKRLVKAAGFEYEGLMKSFDAHGEDRELWALIRQEV